jgi:hypothetical protein
VNTLAVCAVVLWLEELLRALKPGSLEVLALDLLVVWKKVRLWFVTVLGGFKLSIIIHGNLTIGNLESLSILKRLLVGVNLSHQVKHVPRQNIAADGNRRDSVRNSIAFKDGYGMGHSLT